MARPTDDEIIRSVAGELPVGVWVARAPGGEFVYANQTFAEIMGMGARDDVAVGEYAKPYGIHARTGEVYPEDRMPFVRALRERRTVIVDDIVIHRTDGRKVHIRATAKPFFDEAGEPTHVMIAFIDITREAEAEASRAEMDQRLQRAQRMEAIGNLAGGIAHDFNNLLAAVRLIASNLRRGDGDPAQKEDLGRILEATDAAVNLTRALLGFAGRGKHLAEPLSLNTVVRELGPLVQRTLDRRIQVSLELGAATGRVIGDRAQLEQVVLNLVFNARDAMAGGGRLSVRTSDARLAGGDDVVLEVIDTGPGIDPAIRDRIFEPYFTTKTSGDVRGTGLGLATVYGIVQAHGGRIEAEDAQPHGTVMRVRLPAAPGPRPEAAARAPALARPGKGTILVVDDEPRVRDAAASALARLGYQVLTASDGEDALDLYRARHAEVDAVVLDMVMPRKAGRAAYLALREIDPGVRVLLTTGYALNEEAQGILDLGVRAFLAKPYDLETLSDALARVIET